MQNFQKFKDLAMRKKQMIGKSFKEAHLPPV